MYTLCHSYIFRNCFNFCHSTTLSHRKRVLKHPINMTSNSGFVRPEKFHPYTDGLLACIQQTGKNWRLCLYLINWKNLMVVFIFNCKHSHALMLLYLIGYDYTHSTVSHSEHFKDPLTGTHTNTIEGRYWYLCVGIEFDTICYFCQVVLR